jgi:hypothetical protein
MKTDLATFDNSGDRAGSLGELLRVAVPLVIAIILMRSL